MLKFNIIPLLLFLKIIPRAISHSIKILSKDKISTGLGDKLFPFHNIVSLNPRRLPILSSNTKPSISPRGIISTIDPSVEKFGLIENGLFASV